MKKIIFTLCVSAVTFAASGQINDSTELGPGYANQSYYSMANGEVANVDNNNWDLAFDLSGFGAAIRLNRRIDVMYVYPNDTSNWASLDTAGHQNWDSYLNGYEDWSQGALNADADLADPADLGWGMYNSLTHFTEGDRIFVIELSDGSYRKVWIQLLAGGEYTFKFDYLDNSNEQTVTITKSDYAGKNFVYYSLENEMIIDREPLSADWDIVFTNYALELAPSYISTVTGVLHNVDCYVQEINTVPANQAVYNEGAVEANISTIGYNWKTYDFGSGGYLIEDSLSYFVQTATGDVWQLVFTGFNGSSDGKSYFTKELIGAASFDENQITELVTYPNPAVNELNIFNLENISELSVYSLNGQEVFRFDNDENQNLLQLDVSDFPSGLYVLKAQSTTGGVVSQKIVIQ